MPPDKYLESLAFNTKQQGERREINTVGNVNQGSKYKATKVYL